jgi:hypothetical protein
MCSGADEDITSYDDDDVIFRPVISIGELRVNICTEEEEEGGEGVVVEDAGISVIACCFDFFISSSTF